MRLSVVAACLSLCLVGFATANDAYASIRKDTNIPAEGLGPALNALARDRNFQIVYVTEEIANVRTEGAVGEFTTEEALKRLLTGTGLTYRYLDDKTVTIGSANIPRSDRASKATSLESSGDSNANQEGKKSSSNGFRVAQVDQGTTSSPAALSRPGQNSTSTPETSSQLTEIIVTAQKREERLIDTPQSVSVLSADDIARLGATQFRDFANTVPGLSFTTTGAGYTQVTLRGVTAGVDVSSTVGIYVDDVPFGTSGAFAQGAQQALDAGLFDLERIEVLRGPQGTLYGASTMGGLIKYVSKRPDATSFSGDVQTGVSDTHDGGVNYHVAGVVNIPLISDELAMRVSAFESHDGGYIDNVALGQSDVNRSNVYGGRLDLLFTPSDALTIRLGGFLQNISRDGESTADYSFAGVPLYGTLDQSRKVAEPFHQQFRLGNATAAYDFGPASLTSISSYQTSNWNYTSDFSGTYALFCPFVGLPPCSAVGIPYSINTDKFTEELRLASKAGGTLEWLLGGYYTHEDSSRFLATTPFDLAGRSLPNNLFTLSTPSTYKESAAFGDLTWHLSRKLDVTGGVRYAHDDQRFTQYGTFLVPTEPTRTSAEGVFTYLGNVRYHVNENATAYLRYATGYRPGGPNYVANDPLTGLPIAPSTFQADHLKSYEAGFKAETQERQYGFDAAIYYIDWSNIQILASKDNFTVFANAPGGATVEGAELSLTARPMVGFLATGAFAYQHAYLKQADPDLGAPAGAPLPNVPRFMGNINVDYDLHVANVRPSIGASLRYVSDRFASFDHSALSPQYRLPAYTSVDLRSGLQLGKSHAQLYVHNLFDNHGQLSAYTNRGIAQPALMQPRTIGVNFDVPF